MSCSSPGVTSCSCRFRSSNHIEPRTRTQRYLSDTAPHMRRTDPSDSTNIGWAIPQFARKMTQLLSNLLLCSLAFAGLNKLGHGFPPREQAARRFLQDSNTLTQELIRWKQSPHFAEAKQLGVYAGNPVRTSKISPLSSTSQANVSTEDLWRFALAKATIAELQDKHPQATFSTATPFALLTTEDFKQFVGRSGLTELTRKEGTTHLRTTSSQTPTNTSNSANHSSSHRRLADYFDWSEMGCVTPAKNQGGCGSCAYFAAAAAVESGKCIFQGGGITPLSEQFLVSCFPYGYGCGGAWPNRIIEWIHTDGVCLGADVPYTAGDTNTNGNCSAIQCNKVHPPIVVTVEVAANNEDALVDAISTQPVAVTLAGGDSAFQFYSGGVLEGCNPSSPVDHAVLAVGYGHDHGLYYKLKNSWGEWWGEKGFVRLRRGASTPGGACRIAENAASYPAFF